MNYSKDLKSPKWQKKRLEILQRDEWKCTACNDDSTTLCVHHKEYHKDKKPWEYDNDFLVTLCEKCHQYEHLLDIYFKEEQKLCRMLEKLMMPNNVVDQYNNVSSMLNNIFEKYQIK
ncbi:MAG: HNH endonuclease [Gammaproteobacteria bacterium]|nr:HNH endonuclease [Gammaproteobacteria bacterium]